MKHRVVGTCCKNLTQIRQLYCCCNSRGKEGSLKGGFYPKLSGSWGRCFNHHLLNSQHQVSVWRLFPKVSGLVSRCSQAAHHPPLRPPIIIICISTKLYTVHHVVQYVQRFKVVQHMCANHLIIFSQTIEHFGWYDAFLGWRLFTKALYWSTFFCGRVISQCKLSNGLYLLQLTLCTALC